MASFPPFIIGTPIPNGVTPNRIFSDVWQGVLPTPGITLSGSLITLTASGYTIGTRVTDPSLRFNKFAYTAGTTGIYTLTVTAVTPVVGKLYKIQLYGGSQTNPYGFTWSVIAATTSTTDLATAIAAQITNSGQSAAVTATSSGSVVTINEVVATTGGFTITFTGDVNAVFATSTSNVLPVGTLAQVALYKLPGVVTSGTFNLYQWSYDVKYPNFDGNGDDAVRREFVEIWIDLAATNYSLVDTAMVQAGGLTTAYFGATSYSALLMAQTFGVPN